MNFDNKTIKNITIFLIFTFLVVFVFILPNKTGKENFVSRGVSRIITPISKVFRDAGNKINVLFGGLSTEDKESLEQMELKLKSLEEINRKQNDIIMRSDALKAEYNMVNNTIKKLIKANISAVTPGAWFDSFTIDIGKSDGIEVGDSVVFAGSENKDNLEGMVGVISKVFDSYSEVTAITDDSIRVSMRTIRSQDGAILTGTKDGYLYGYMFDRNSDVIVGDKFLTSGMGEVVKEGLYIGEVVKVESDDALMKKLIYIAPAVDFKHLRRVYVVK